MRIGFIGDTHGRWDDLYRAMGRLLEEGAEMLIQVGDFGWWPSDQKIDAGNIDALELDHPVYWIDGNHEHFEFLKDSVEWDRKEPQEVRPNCLYIPRGTVLELGGMRFGFMGGGCSIDRYMRTEGVSYFRDEIPSYTEYCQMMEVGEVDVMVTHDAPHVPDHLIGYKNDTQSEGNRRSLRMLKDALDPRYWVSGHYHKHFHREVASCNTVGLADCAAVFDRCTVIFDTEKPDWIL